MNSWSALMILGATLGGLALFWFHRHTGRRPIAWFRFQLGWGRTVEDLARRLGIEPGRLRDTVPAYREHHLPKRGGGRRRLLIPDDDLKSLQRRILRRILARLRCHPAATAYRKGLSIVDNARPHSGKAVVVKLDLVDFFPSLSADRVDRYFRFIGWNREAAALLTRLCVHDNGLPQGAPTSPALSNLLMNGFDHRLSRRMARWKDASYTRYADDITLSFRKDSPRKIRGMVQFVVRLSRSHGLRVHVGRKRKFLRRHQQQRVTGLVVNDKARLPRRVRRRLRAIEHHARTGRTPTLTEAQLRGWRALVAMIERRRT